MSRNADVIQLRPIYLGHGEDFASVRKSTAIDLNLGRSDYPETKPWGIHTHGPYSPARRGNYPARRPSPHTRFAATPFNSKLRIHAVATCPSKRFDLEYALNYNDESRNCSCMDLAVIVQISS